MVGFIALVLTGCSTVGLVICRERFVCVEPGYARGFKRLEPGESWVGEQVLVVV